MTIKSVLVPIDGGAASFAALEQAFVVADRFGAHIKALHVMQRIADGSPVGMYNLSAEMRKNIEHTVESSALDTAQELRARFEELCRQQGVGLGERSAEPQLGATASWHQEWGRVNDVVVAYGRISDAILVRRPALKKSTVRRARLGESIEAIMLASARPVMLVPPGAVAKQCGKVAFGWNESAEASRALAMTLPWLSAMGAVTVMVSEKRQPRVARLVEYLGWHGVKAEVELLDGRGDSVGESMLNVCSDVGAELLVVGGFSQGGARQMFFGGVTEHLLEHSTVLTAMVH